MEHAYALTGHGMQGGTVETALVVATPRDLTAGWSYTALSRGRGETSLLIHPHPEHDRAEIGPDDGTPSQTREDLLAAAARRMRERDDEDLALDQLPASHVTSPGRENDEELAAARAYAAEPDQEQAASRAEPQMRATRADTPAEKAARLRALGDRIEQLRAQAAALPRRELRLIEDLDARAGTLAGQRARLAERLAALPTPEPTGRRGPDHDAHAVERARLTTALQACERDQQALLTQRAKLLDELGDPGEIRAERDALQQTLKELTREHPQLRDELTDHKSHELSPHLNRGLVVVRRVEVDIEL